MSNQTHQEPVKDLAKKRREYLIEKARADSNVALAAIATWGCGGMSAFMVFAVAFALLFSPPFAYLTILAGGLVTLVVLGIGTWFAALQWRAYVEEAKSIAYVPPVT